MKLNIADVRDFDLKNFNLDNIGSKYKKEYKTGTLHNIKKDTNLLRKSAAFGMMHWMQEQEQQEVVNIIVAISGATMFMIFRLVNMLKKAS